MERQARTTSKVVTSICCCTVALYSAAAHGQNTKRRCYTVEETLYKVHHVKMTPEIKPIKHCYSEGDHPYRYSVMDIPVSLAEGTVRTPEFFSATHRYWIMVEVEKPPPTQQIRCMMAAADDSLQSLKDCPLNDRLLRADWTVLEDGVMTSGGSSTAHADAQYTTDHVFKFLGSFPANSGKKYVIAVKFTNDGTALNIANPHL